MTNKERFLAGEIFTISDSVIRYKFDGNQKVPAIEIRIKPAGFGYFTLIDIGETKVKWKKMLLGKWIEGQFKYSDLKFLDAKVGDPE